MESWLRKQIQPSKWRPERGGGSEERRWSRTTDGRVGLKPLPGRGWCQPKLGLLGYEHP